jgi:hypothetical protein
MSSTSGIDVLSDITRTVPSELLRARLLQGRLNGALSDLGLAENLPTGWVTSACSGWYFSPFNHHQASKLVVALEEFTAVLDGAGLEKHLRAGASPGPGQQAFQFGDPGGCTGADATLRADLFQGRMHGRRRTQ